MADDGEEHRWRAREPRRSRRTPDDAESALRGLVGGGRSKLPLDAALRARDVAVPGEEDLAEAERLIDARLAERARGGPRPGPGRRPWRAAPGGHGPGEDPAGGR